MKTLLWLLAYDITLVAGVTMSVWLTRSMKKQIAHYGQGIAPAIKLLITASALVLAGFIVLYVAGFLAYASTR